MADSTYAEALRLLSRRELSEAQLRQRLARRGHDVASIDTVIARLRADRSIDDVRVAEIIARSETSLRKRGPHRVRRRIEAAGIAPATAKAAVDAAFRDIDHDALMSAALEKRLRGRATVEDEDEFQRLYRFLIGQGFDSDRVIALLRTRQGKR